MKLYEVERGKKTHLCFLLRWFRKHLIQFGMAYGLSYGDLGLGVGCGEIIIKNMYDITWSAVILEEPSHSI